MSWGTKKQGKKPNLNTNWMWGWSEREEQTLVGGSEALSWSESTDATAVVKGRAHVVGSLKEERKLQFWFMLETKLMGKEWVLLGTTPCLLVFPLCEGRVVACCWVWFWATNVVDELKVRVATPSIVVFFLRWQFFFANFYCNSEC